MRHGNWKGLTYSQLAVLFVVYVVHGLNHRLYQMEQWVEEHFHVISQACGWTLSSKDATDDRVGAMMHVLGADTSRHISFQRESGRHYIQAYALPTDVVRYDTTSFNVYHGASSKASNGLLSFGHSKDHRPDLLQFKEGSLPALPIYLHLPERIRGFMMLLSVALQEHHLDRIRSQEEPRRLK
jgi:transposase